MKSLVEFLRESAADSNEYPQEMTFKFDFKELPEAEETLKTVEEMASKDGLNVTTDNNVLTLTLTRSQCDNGEAKSLVDFMTDYVKKIRNDQKNASSEPFAQLTKRFKEEFDKVKEFVNFVPEEPKDEDE